MFYAKVIDFTILVSLGNFAASKTSGTIETEKEIHKLLNYCAKNPNSTLRYKAINMVLKAHSDASYLSESQARSKAGGFFYMGWEKK